MGSFAIGVTSSSGAPCSSSSCACSTNGNSGSSPMATGATGASASSCHAATIRANLTAEDHLVIMLRHPSGKIKLLHHFKYDAVSPLRPEASNQLWAILGHAQGQGGPVALAPDGAWLRDALSDSRTALESLLHANPIEGERQYEKKDVGDENDVTPWVPPSPE
jgi:hypothetical protein